MFTQTNEDIHSRRTPTYTHSSLDRRINIYFIYTHTKKSTWNLLRKYLGAPDMKKRSDIYKGSLLNGYIQT